MSHIKSKKAFGLLAISSFVAFGSLIAFKYSNSKSKETVAASASTLYLNLGSIQSYWQGKLAEAGGSAFIGAYFFGGTAGSSAWPGTHMTKVSDSIYSVVNMSTATKIIFNVNGWSGDCQTVDLTIPTSGKNLFTISTTNYSSEQNGNWSTYEEPASSSESSSSSSSSTIDIEAPSYGDQANLDGKYATYYQLLVYSFADGNGDGIGDFKGIVEHLDYLENLGIGGIYLSPIQKADSYHGYDITDYFSVNPLYEVGEYTLTRLLSECHARNIKVILDMVLNHSSYNHPWRISHPSWYSGEDAFLGMIDFNFDNTSLRNKIKEIGQFWLTNYDVDGYRLDAIKYIYNTGNYDPTPAQHARTIAWWNEFYETCKDVKDDVYMIGEDYTYDLGEIYDYQTSGLDSLFDFITVDTIDSAARLSRPKDYINYLPLYQDVLKEAYSGTIQASFLSNHDRGRYGQNLSPARFSVAGMMNILSPGNSFVYYGDELNLQASLNGGYEDFWHRTPMPFASGKTNMKTYLNGFSDQYAPFISCTSLPYSGATADVDAASSSSIYAAYAKTIALKNNNPILYDGTVSTNGNNKDNEIGSFIVTKGYDAVTVIFNTGSSNKIVEFSHTVNPLGGVSYSGTSTLTNGNKLTLAPFSVVLLEGNQKLDKDPKSGLYLRGSMTSWDALDSYELMNASTPYYEAKILNVSFKANEQFKISDASWSDSSTYGYYQLSTGEHDYSSYITIGDGDNIKIRKACTFNIYLGDGSITMTKVDDLEVAEGGFLRGSWNSDWGYETADQIEMVEVSPFDVYKAERVALSANDQFKLVIYENGLDYWISCDSATYTANYPAYPIDDNYGGFNATVTKEGIYDVTITNSGTSWNYDVQLVSTENPYTIAISYAETFNATLAEICSVSNQTDVDSLNNAWTSLASYFANLSSDAKAILKSDLSVSSSEDLVAFAKKYTYIYQKYSSYLTSGNFASREVNLSGASITSVNGKLINNTYLIVVIALVSTISISALSIYLFRKKKQSQI